MEGLKKYRISLKFSEKDPRQVDVANLLKQLGRKKSAFITEAVKYYLENNPNPNIPGNNNVLTNMLTENIVKNTILKMIQSGELVYTNLQPEQKEKNKISKEIIENLNVDKIEEPSIVPITETKNVETNSDIDDMLDMLDSAFD